MADEGAFRAWSEYVKRLHAARHIALVPAGALAVAGSVLVALGLVLLLARGQIDVIRVLPHLLIMSGAFGLLGWFMVPGIEAKLARAANEGAEPWRCPALMEAAVGLPMFRHRSRFEDGLARCLRAVTKEWWEQNDAQMHQPVKKLLTFPPPGPHAIANGPVVVALLDAIGRCERTEFLKHVERYAGRGNGQTPDEVRDAAERCTLVLRDRVRRDREAATLLRPAETPPDTLLRPVEPRTPEQDMLLVRPADHTTEKCETHERTAHSVERGDEVIMQQETHP